MSDKKISELTALSTVSKDDLFIVVDSPGGTPITKSITAGALFSNVTFVTEAAEAATGAIAIGGFVSSNVNTAASQTITGGKFTVTASATSQNTANQYGVLAISTLGAPTANVIGEHAAGKFVLDVSNAAALVVDTYGAIIRVANTGTRAAQPTAFLKLEEQLTAQNTLSTKYVLSLNCAANGTSTNVTTAFSNCGATPTSTHKLRVTINGTDYFILLSTAASAVT